MSQASNYSAIRDFLLFLNDSYQGGLAYSTPSPSILSSTSTITRWFNNETGRVVEREGDRFQTYLLPHDAETSRDFAARIQKAAYINLCQPLVSAYTDAALQKVDRNLGGLTEALTEDVDYKESTYSEFIAQCADNFAVYGFSFVVVDVDSIDPRKPRYIPVDPTKVCYIQTDDYGRLEAFAWINQSEYKNETQPTIQNITVTLVDKQGFHTLNGMIDVRKGIDLRKLKTLNMVPLSPTLNGDLPVVVGYFKRDTTSILPLGISLIADTAQVGRTIYNLLSSASDILQMHFPLLTLPMKKTGGSMSVEAEIAVSSKTALPYDSDTNAPTYINPSKESTEELRQHSDWLARWAFKLAGLDIEQASVPQSGISLRIKSRDFENRVKAFANQLQKFEIKLLKTTCQLLGVSFNDISVSYPDRFTLPDTAENVANALAVLTLSKNIVDLGPQAKLSAIRYFLTNALPLGDSELAKILKEIEVNLQNPQPLQEVTISSEPTQ
jgi:hypothetical protein